MADIEKAFLMIEIKQSDRDMLRFLWLKSPHDVESDVLELRFTRLVFGLRPSPAILGCVISQHLDGYQARYPGVIQYQARYPGVIQYQARYPRVIQSIKNLFYVDDLLTGGDTVEEAFNTYLVASKVMSEGGFNLRKWNSNSPELLTRITSASEDTVSNSDVNNSQKGNDVTSKFVAGANTEGNEQSKLLGIN